MIDKQLELGVCLILNQAQSLFQKKTQDYGTISWRILRMISLADQLFIKAKRIGEISTGIQKVTGPGNDIESEFIGLINYAVIGMIQNRFEELQPGEKPMPAEEAISNYSDIADKFYSYFKNQHAYLADKIQGYSTKKFSEKLQIKCQRIKYISKIKNEGARKIVLFGAFMEILFWSTVGHVAYKSTQ